MHEKRRRARLKPVVAEFRLIESVEQTERVVYPNTVACEVIAVVKLTEFVAYSIIVGAGGIGQFMQGVLEISVYFLSVMPQMSI